MKHYLTVFAVLISGFYLSASGSLLTIRAGNDYYQYKNRIDTTAGDNRLYFDFGFGLEDIGGSGLSFQTDGKASNAFIDGVGGASARRTYDITSGYFDWKNANNAFGVRLGRQQYSNLSFDSYDFDGLSIAVQPTAKASVNLAAGLLTPSPWGKQVVGIQEGIDPLTSQPFYRPDTSYKHYLIGNPANSLVAMLEMSKKGFITIEKVIQKMCHAPADLFRIDKRGYIREGYFADLVLVNPNQSWTVSSENILYKCGWSPFEGTKFSHKVLNTFVNGRLIYDGSDIININGQRIEFTI